MRISGLLVLPFLISTCANHPKISENNGGKEPGDIIQLLKESYEIAQRPTNADKIDAYKKNQLALEKIDWAQSTHQEIVWNFISEHLDFQRGTLATHIPTALFSAENMGSWFDYFNQNLESCKMMLPERGSQRKCLALQSMMSTALSLWISHSEEGTNETSLVSFKLLKEKIASVYEDWNLSYSQDKVSLRWPYFDHGFFLEMGSWIGDTRAYELALRAIKSEAHKRKVYRENYQLALIIVSAFIDQPRAIEARAIIRAASKDRLLGANFRAFLAKFLKGNVHQKQKMRKNKQRSHKKS